MPDSFYSDSYYRKRQSEIVKQAWRSGVYDFMIKPPISKVCKRPGCKKSFLVKPHEIKKFCSTKCSALVNNPGRTLSALTKAKISKALKLLPKSRRGKHFTKTKISLICVACKKTFELVPYLAKNRMYCNSKCASRALGRMTTSPKASKGKNGIRKDIHPEINFYSTWEANIARVFNLVGLKWQYAPKMFDLGEHTYRPDFYLPNFGSFVEVKNFMGEYSLERDRLFREKFPNIKLDLILKDDYFQIKQNYKDLVDNWEY